MKNGITEASVSTPTVTKAGQNTSAVIAPPWALVDSCSEIAPMVMPSDTAICCATLVMVVAWLICACDTSAKASALTAVNSSERKNPPIKSRLTISVTGVVGTKIAGSAVKAAPSTVLISSTLRKP